MIQLQSTDRIQKVTFLSDVDVQWLSLVERGANWTPFVVEKADSRPGPGGGDHTGEEATQMAGQVIHAILVPKGMSIDKLRGQFGDDFDGVLEKLDEGSGEDHDGHVKYVAAAKGDFDEATLATKVLDGGVAVIAGALKSEPAAGAGDIGDSDQKAAADSDGAVDGDEHEEPATVVIDVLSKEDLVESFGPTLKEKTRAFRDVVHGALSLPGDAAKRRRTIMGAHAALGKWLGASINQLGGAAVAAKSDDAPPVQPAFAETLDQLPDILAQVVGALDTLAEKFDDLAGEVADLGESHQKDRKSLQKLIASQLEDVRGQTKEALDEVHSRVDGIAGKQEALTHSVGRRNNYETTPQPRGEGSVWVGIL